MVSVQPKEYRGVLYHSNSPELSVRFYYVWTDKYPFQTLLKDCLYLPAYGCYCFWSECISLAIDKIIESHTLVLAKFALDGPEYQDAVKTEFGSETE